MAATAKGVIRDPDGQAHVYRIRRMAGGTGRYEAIVDGQEIGAGFSDPDDAYARVYEYVVTNHGRKEYR